MRPNIKYSVNNIMSSTYLASRRIIDLLMANPQFVYLAKTLVNSDKCSTIYSKTYDELNALLTSIGINNQVDVFKSDGEYWYSNILTPNNPILINNFNNIPEVSIAVNHAFGNPIRNKKLYPIELQSSVCSGYGFGERLSKYLFIKEQYVAKTYKSTPSPLSTDVFTIRVVQKA